MYIEKIGYVIMDWNNMSFLDNDDGFSEEVEDARVFTELAEAIDKCKSLIDESEQKYAYEIIKYNQTTWLDRCFSDAIVEDENNTKETGNPFFVF